MDPIDSLSDIDNLASFKRSLSEEYSFKHQMKMLLVFMSISPRRSALLKHEQCLCQLKGCLMFIIIYVVTLIR